MTENFCCHGSQGTSHVVSTRLPWSEILHHKVTMALVSPVKKKDKRHPLNEFRKEWQRCPKKQQDSFDFEPWREELESFIHLLANSGACEDIHNPGRRINCTCLQDLDFSDEEEQEAIFDYLFQYAKMSWSEQRAIIREWKRYATGFRITSGMRNNHQVYLLPGSPTHRICKNALAKLIGKEHLPSCQTSSGTNCTTSGDALSQKTGKKVLFITAKNLLRLSKRRLASRLNKQRRLERSDLAVPIVSWLRNKSSLLERCLLKRGLENSLQVLWPLGTAPLLYCRCCLYFNRIFGAPLVAFIMLVSDGNTLIVVFSRRWFSYLRTTDVPSTLVSILPALDVESQHGS